MRWTWSVGWFHVSPLFNPRSSAHNCEPFCSGTVEAAQNLVCLAWHDSRWIWETLYSQPPSSKDLLHPNPGVTLTMTSKKPLETWVLISYSSKGHPLYTTFQKLRNSVLSPMLQKTTADLRSTLKKFFDLRSDKTNEKSFPQQVFFEINESIKISFLAAKPL